MSHELATTNGRTAMMYAGEIPWHGLGTRLDEPATAGEAIEAAGLNYQVDLKDIETIDGIPIRQRRAVIRSDSNDVLEVVGANASLIRVIDHGGVLRFRLTIYTEQTHVEGQCWTQPETFTGFLLLLSVESCDIHPGKRLANTMPLVICRRMQRS